MTLDKERMAKSRQATEWREVSNNLYARAVYKEIVAPIDHLPMEAIAGELNAMQVPRLRGSGPWDAGEVSRLIARVAAMAGNTTSYNGWKAAMRQF